MIEGGGEGVWEGGERDGGERGGGERWGRGDSHIMDDQRTML